MDIKITLEDGMKVNAIVDGQVIKTDQSPESGGEGSAPEPFTLFLVSMGTCAGVYVKSFCRSRNIPDEGISIIQHIDRNPETHMVEKIDIEIKLPSGFPEKYKQAVVNAANLCTVKKHLKNPPEVMVRA